MAQDEFHVYCLIRGTKEPKRLASFARQVEAEAFIHGQLLKCDDFGVDAGRFWGLGGEGGNVHYWVETSQQTISVREAK